MYSRQFAHLASSSPENKHSPKHKSKSPQHHMAGQIQPLPAASPIKILLQNNIKLNTGKNSERSPQEVQIITHLIKESTIFAELEIDLSDSSLCKELCNGIVLIYCESPHIMQIKDNQLYIFFEGQGFEYMQNTYSSQESKKYKLYDNNQYIMLRKLVANQYFLAMQEPTQRYYAAQKKYQLMVDQNALIGKFSQEIFYKVFHNKILERQRSITAVLKKVQIFAGLPASFFHEFSKFVSEQKRPAGQKVLQKEEKAKFVYFVKSGSAEVRSFNQAGSRPAVSSNQNYYISSQRPYTFVSLGKHDSFGMEPPEQAEIEKEVICSSDCVFMKIDKRLLAIIITSYDLEFQQKNKLWSEVNINNQIKGQNYLSPQKELLLKNVERIRTSERKIRDIKLKYLSSNKSKKEVLPFPIPKQDSVKEAIKELPQEDKREASRINSPDERRRMIKTTQGRFRSSQSIFRFINNFGVLEDQRNYEAIRRKLEEEREGQYIQRLNQIEIVAIESDDPRPSQRLLYHNASEYRGRVYDQRWAKSTSKLQNHQFSNKFVPKLQVKSTIISSSTNRDSQMIGVFLDKKIKNQIVKKAERVLSINKNVKLTENKNLKRLFAPSLTRNLNAISQIDKKSIADDIVDKMSNLRENPLLLQIESQRRKLERQLKLSLRKAKASQPASLNKKYKKEDQLILIKNNQ